MHVLTFRYGRVGRPVSTELPIALDDYCPAARLVAQNLLRHPLPPDRQHNHKRDHRANEIARSSELFERSRSLSDPPPTVTCLR